MVDLHDELTEAANKLHYAIEYLENGAFSVADMAREGREVRDVLYEIANRDQPNDEEEASR